MSAETDARGQRGVFSVSAKSGTGVGELVDEIGLRVRNQLEGSEGVGLARARQVEAMKLCVSCLDEVLEFGNGGEAELIGEGLRGCLSALGRITGRVDVEDLLDVVFGEFCIGK